MTDKNKINIKINNGFKLDAPVSKVYAPTH